MAEGRAWAGRVAGLFPGPGLPMRLLLGSMYWPLLSFRRDLLEIFKLLEMRV